MIYSVFIFIQCHHLMDRLINAKIKAYFVHPQCTQSMLCWKNLVVCIMLITFTSHVLYSYPRIHMKTEIYFGLKAQTDVDMFE